MAARKRRASDAVRTAGSWMALLAATTLGTDVAAEPVHAEVRIESPALVGKGEAFRLIVQSYDAGDLASLKSGNGRAKPVGSMQRVVSAEELAKGIRVDFVELREGERAQASAENGKRPLVVAWLESVRGNYDLDARDARPRAGSLLGYARRVARDVKIRLDRRA